MTRRIYIYISRSCHRDRLPTTSCKKNEKKGKDNGPETRRMYHSRWPESLETTQALSKYNLSYVLYASVESRHGKYLRIKRKNEETINISTWNINVRKRTCDNLRFNEASRETSTMLIKCYRKLQYKSNIQWQLIAPISYHLAISPIINLRSN